MKASCKGLHCPGCADGGGPVIALVLVVVVAAVISANARAIGHVLVLVAIAGASLILAALSVAALVMLRRRIRRAELAASAARETVVRIDTAARRVQGLAPAPRAALEAPRAELPARVRIWSPAGRERVAR